MIRKNNLLFLWVCLCTTITFGQLNTYNYKIALSGINDPWHTIELPDALFEKVSRNMTGLRIYGVTPNDTIEAPYLLKVAKEKKVSKQVNFNILNIVSNTKGYYFTYEIPNSDVINEIQLDFKNTNFDWEIVLEGSQNLEEWFTLLNDYRLLSIKNSETNYSFTKLHFKDSKYRYYRLLIKSDVKPDILQSSIKINAQTTANYNTYSINQIHIKEVNKRTLIDIDLKQHLPLSYLKINISDLVDYYRPYTLQYVSDSLKTEKGWRYNYRNLGFGTLSSFEKNELKFTSTLAKKIRLIIENDDNQPLTIDSIQAKGYNHKLIARFHQPANYYLAYGKTHSKKPKYDIGQAASKIPNNPKKLILGEIELISKNKDSSESSLFENKIWLWIIMGIMIVVLGGFSLHMIQKK